MEVVEPSWGRKTALYQLSIWPWEVFRSFHSCFSGCQIIHDSWWGAALWAWMILPFSGFPGAQILLAEPSTCSLFGELINNDLEEKWFNITKLFQDQLKVPEYSKTVRYVRAGALWGMCFVPLMWQTYCSKFSNMHLLLPFPKPCHQAITFRSVMLNEEMQKDLLLEMLFLVHWMVCNGSDVQNVPQIWGGGSGCISYHSWIKNFSC